MLDTFLYLLRSYFVCLSTKSVFVLGEARAMLDTFLYLLRSYFVCLSTKSVFVLGEERALEQQRLNSRRLLKKVSKRKDTPMSAEGLSHSLRWVRAKLADKQQSAQTSPHLNRSRSWTLQSAPIGEKGIVLSINFFIYYRFIAFVEGDYYLFRSYFVCQSPVRF